MTKLLYNKLLYNNLCELNEKISKDFDCVLYVIYRMLSNYELLATLIILRNLVLTPTCYAVCE